MSTNYYATGLGGKPLHIGKSSGGWCFSLRVYSELEGDPNIQSLEDWMAIWAQPGVAIVDEYDHPVSPAEMIQIITVRRLASRPEGPENTPIMRRGTLSLPNGPRRHRGEGITYPADPKATYDYVSYDFC